MRKNVFYFSCLLMAMSSLLFVSCDDDIDRAMVLSGEWYGDFGMCYYFSYEEGEVQYNSYDTHIVFYPDYDYATHGYGKQVDYYREGPYERRYYRFDWKVSDDVIYLRYPRDPELNTEIYDYRLDRDFFSGYFSNANDRFRLRKLTDYYDWSDYRDDCDYYEWHSDRYWYAPKTKASDNAPVEITVRNGRRITNFVK